MRLQFVCMINLAIQTSHHFHMSSSVIFYSNQQHSQVQTADDTDTVTDSVSRITVTPVEKNVIE